MQRTIFRISGVRALSAGVILTLLPGCYRKHPSYPGTWPRITESKDIENIIEGRYSCSGDIVRTQGGLWTKSSVSGFLIGGKSPPYCDHIEIGRPSPEEITIRFISGENEVVTKSYKRNRGYHVEDGWTVLKGIGEWAAEDIVAAHESQKPQLTLNHENDLVIKQTITMLGTITIVVPVGGSATEWGRFQRLQ